MESSRCLSKQSKFYKTKLIVLVALIIFASQGIASAFSLSAVGDVDLGGRVASYINRYGYGYPYQNVKDLLSSTDLTFGNLECALSVSGRPAAKKKYTFRGSPGNAPFLKKAGFDVMSIANNHSKDFGNQAFLDTVNCLVNAQVVPVGGGANLAGAFQPQVVEVDGQKIAFLAFSDVVPAGFAASSSSPGTASLRNWRAVASAITDAKSKASFVVVSVHWGKELSAYPAQRQIKLAHQMIDQGADLIIGHHPHVVQGVEIYRSKIIAYSLGNFIFSPGSSKGRQSVILSIRADRGKITGARIYPVYISGIQPRILTGSQGQKWLGEVSKRSRKFKTPLTMVTSEAYPYLRLPF